jgi:hypothetical protein
LALVFVDAELVLKWASQSSPESTVHPGGTLLQEADNSVGLVAVTLLPYSATAAAKQFDSDTTGIPGIDGGNTHESEIFLLLQAVRLVALVNVSVKS